MLDRAPAPNDLNAFWMPFTSNRQFKKAPRMFVAAKDMHYTTSDGHQVLDGTAGLWCCNAGHCRPRITEAIQRQAAELDYAPAFQMGHPLAFGRLGSAFAAQRFGVTPDLMTTAKGLTNGVIPMGAVLTTAEVPDALSSTSATWASSARWSGSPFPASPPSGRSRPSSTPTTGASSSVRPGTSSPCRRRSSSRRPRSMSSSARSGMF